jgi:hypothetical protein
MGKLSTMITEGRNADNSNILDRIDDSLELDSESWLSILNKFIMLGLIWFASAKLPQNSELILTMCGSLLTMVLLVLFPILIFNKVFKHT